MNPTYLTRLINLALRGMTLVSKFLLIFILARYLEPSELGLYGLLIATISYALYLLGFDFYAFTTREILKLEPGERGGLLKSQVALTLVLYVIFLPLLCLIFALELLPWYLAGWFFVLLIVEHIAQELGRLLVAISEPLLASWIMFLRGGLWAIFITGLMFFQAETRTLHYVLAAWSLGGISSVVLGLYRIKQLRMGGWHKHIDWLWIIKGLKVAIPLLVATLALRGLFTFDRYFFEALQGLEILAAYVLFIGVCNALMSFLDAGVFVFLYPQMISAYNRQENDAFKKCMRALLLQTIAVTLVVSLISFLVLPYLLEWIGKSVYLEQVSLFPWLLLSTGIYALGMIPHYGLYAQGYDRPIIFSHIAGLFIFLIAAWLMSLYSQQIAVPVGLCVAFTFILFWKSLAFFKLTPAQYRTIV